MTTYLTEEQVREKCGTEEPHRIDAWPLDSFEGEYRPVLKGEPFQEGDEYYCSSWSPRKRASGCKADYYHCPTRTKRPLPPEFAPKSAEPSNGWVAWTGGECPLASDEWRMLDDDEEMLVGDEWRHDSQRWNTSIILAGLVKDIREAMRKDMRLSFEARTKRSRITPKSEPKTKPETNTMAVIHPQEPIAVKAPLIAIELPPVGSRWAFNSGYDTNQSGFVVASSASGIAIRTSKDTVKTFGPDQWEGFTKSRIYTRRELRRMSRPTKINPLFDSTTPPAGFVAYGPKKPLWKRIRNWTLSRGFYYTLGGLTGHLAASAILSGIAWIAALWAQHIAK